MLVAVQTQQTPPGYASKQHLTTHVLQPDTGTVESYLQFQALLLHLLLSVLQLLCQQPHSSFPSTSCFLKKSDLEVLSISQGTSFLQLGLGGLKSVLQMIVVGLLALQACLQPAQLRTPILYLGLQRKTSSEGSAPAPKPNPTHSND